MISLFKYTSAKYIDSIVKDGGRLKLSGHEELNDPCDLNFDVSQKNKHDSYRMLLNVAFLCEFGTDPMFSRNKWFQSTCKLTRASMKNNAKYEENPGINMMLRYYLKSRKALKDFFDKYELEFDKTYTKIIEDLKNRTLIGCLTKDYLNKTMWAHYADNNTGICVEYEFDSTDNLWDAIYTTEENDFDLYTILQYILPRQYFKIETKAEDNLQCREACFRPFRRKTIEWKEEKETRLIFSKKNNNELILENGLWFYPNVKVKSIYAGCNIKQDDLRYLKEICKGSSIDLYQLKILKGKTNFEVERIL